MTLEELLNDLVKFNSYMENINSDLQRNNIDVPSRPLHSLKYFGDNFNTTISLNSPLAQAIESWFSKRYGERLQTYLYVGETVVLVSGDPYRTRLPLIYGQVTVNPLKWIIGITPKTLWSLGELKLRNLANKLIHHLDLYNGLNDLANLSTADMASAVELLTRRHPEPGPSLWASLQSTEKVLKSYIKQSGVEPTRTHRLSSLCTTAEGLGLPAVNRSFIEIIQCSADVRYGEKIPLERAVNAVDASLEVCHHVCANYSPKK